MPVVPALLFPALALASLPYPALLTMTTPCLKHPIRKHSIV